MMLYPGLIFVVMVVVQSRFLDPTEHLDLETYPLEFMLFIDNGSLYMKKDLRSGSIMTENGKLTNNLEYIIKFVYRWCFYWLNILYFYKRKTDRCRF